MINIAAICVQQRADVVAHGEAVALVLFQMRMHRGRARFHGCQGIYDYRQILVLNFDEVDCFLSSRFVIRRYRRDGLADEIHRIARHHVAIAQGSGAETHFREIGAHNHSPHSGHRCGFAGVYRNDTGMAARAGQQFAGKRTGQVHIGGVGRSAGYLVIRVDSGVVSSQDFKLGHFKRLRFGRLEGFSRLRTYPALLISSAAAITASTTRE